MVTVNCKQCGHEFTRPGSYAVFCSRECKSLWQETQKPVSKEWLEQKYLAERLSCYAIGKLVHRHPKRVYEWLVSLGIPTRTQKLSRRDPSRKKYHDKEWLLNEYVNKKRSGPEIAAEFGINPGTLTDFLRKFNIPRRTTSETHKVKYWGATGKKNGMYGKFGALCPSWKGGLTPERQKFYSSGEWKFASKSVWKRDGGKCVRCETRLRKRDMHIHHIVSFQVRELRAELTNLILLCKGCHRWVHSKMNTNKEFIKKGGGL